MAHDRLHWPHHYHESTSSASITRRLRSSPAFTITLFIYTATKMPGFDFSNHNRNLALHARGVPLPKATSTGTTIVGCIYDGGVVIAADTRATSGPIVADKVRQRPTLRCRISHHDTDYPGRTARSCTTSAPKSGAQAPGPPPTPSSPPPSSPPTSNSTPCRPAASRAWSPS